MSNGDAGIAGRTLDYGTAWLEGPVPLRRVDDARAARSLTDPPGFMNSALPKISQPVAAERALRRISGVLPMAASKPVATRMATSTYEHSLLGNGAGILDPAIDRDCYEQALNCAGVTPQGRAARSPPIMCTRWARRQTDPDSSGIARNAFAPRGIFSWGSFILLRLRASRGRNFPQGSCRLRLAATRRRHCLAGKPTPHRGARCRPASGRPLPVASPAQSSMRNSATHRRSGDVCDRGRAGVSVPSRRCGVLSTPYTWGVDHSRNVAQDLLRLALAAAAATEPCL